MKFNELSNVKSIPSPKKLMMMTLPDLNTKLN